MHRDDHVKNLARCTLQAVVTVKKPGPLLRNMAVNVQPEQGHRRAAPGIGLAASTQIENAQDAGGPGPQSTDVPRRGYLVVEVAVGGP
jgi:hypothetical protein